VFSGNAIIFSQDTLGLIPEVFDTVDVGVTLSKVDAVIDSDMVKGGNIQDIITW
jgi:hypothetical protein